MVYPWAAFGVLNALSGPVLTTHPTPNFYTILGRAPLTVFWMWINILAFTISNQRLPESVVEDSVNKAWRPLPSGRISAAQSRRLLLAVVPTVCIVTSYLGGRNASMLGLILDWIYNDLRGADENFVIRHLLNAIGLTSWSFGTTAVACGQHDHLFLSSLGYTWLLTEGAIIFTTIHLMDLRDQAGDRARGRATVPIVLGDNVARLTIVFSVMMWSILCPAILSLGVSLARLAPLVLGLLISCRVLSMRTVEADKLSWKIWGFWISSIFILPLFKDR